MKLNNIILCKPNNGFFANKREYTDNATPTIWIGDFIDKDFINISKLKQVNIDKLKKEKYLVSYGDILFCRSSLVREGIAKTGMIPQNIDREVIFEDHVIRITLDKSKVIPEYFKHFTTNQYFRNQMMRLSKTSTMTTIGQKEIINSEVIKPPINLQNKFAQIVEKIETIKTQENQKLAHLETLHSSLMDKAFKGEIG